MPIAAAMQCPTVLSNTFLAHRRGSESCAQPRRQWPRRRAKNALRYAALRIMPISAAKPAWKALIAVKNAA
jgi:hypothetical protein